MWITETDALSIIVDAISVCVRPVRTVAIRSRLLVGRGQMPRKGSAMFRN